MFAHVGGVKHVVGVKAMQFVENFAKAAESIPLVVNHFAACFAANQLQLVLDEDVDTDEKGVVCAVLLDGLDDGLFMLLNLFEIVGTDNVEFGFFVAKDFFAVFDADFFGEGGTAEDDVVVGKT